MILENYQKLQTLENPDWCEFFINVETKWKFGSIQEKSSFLKLLLDDLITKNWTDKIKTQGLSAMRTLGRDPSGSEPLFTREGSVALMKLAGLYQPTKVIDTPSSREALKCIANCIFLKETVKPYLEQEGIINSCQFILKSENQLSLEAQFLSSRILFFLTVNRSDLVHQLIEYDIATPIEKVLTENVAQLENTSTRAAINVNTPINPYTVTSEVLKLVFNLMLVEARNQPGGDGASKPASDTFKNCLVPIFKLLFKVPFAEPQPLVPPHSQAIHALMQFNFESIAQIWASQAEWTSKLYDASDEYGYRYVATTLVNLLDRSIHALIPDGDPDNDNTQQTDSILAPLILVLECMAEGSPILKQVMGKLMLPNEKDRLHPVHEGFSLSAYLIRLMTSTMMPQSRDAISETLFVLCNRDATKFTHAVGYGNAVGFLVNKGIPIDQSSQNEEENNINPITGQYVSEEKVPDLKDMTDEEKEREAERLFVLFERLKKTGIIDVENPIAKAMQEGKFQEIQSDSEDSD